MIVPGRLVVTLCSDGTNNHLFTVIRGQHDVHVFRELNSRWCRLLSYLHYPELKLHPSGLSGHGKKAPLNNLVQ